MCRALGRVCHYASIRGGADRPVYRRGTWAAGTPMRSRYRCDCYVDGFGCRKGGAVSTFFAGRKTQAQKSEAATCAKRRSGVAKRPAECAGNAYGMSTSYERWQRPAGEGAMMLSAIVVQRRVGIPPRACRVLAGAPLVSRAVDIVSRHGQPGEALIGATSMVCRYRQGRARPCADAAYHRLAWHSRGRRDARSDISQAARRRPRP